MQRSTVAIRQTGQTFVLAAILCLAFLTWFVAELSNGFFADGYFLVSLLLALGMGTCAVRLWQSLQQERVLRRLAEDELRAAALRWRENGGAETTQRTHDEPPSASLGLLTAREVEVLSLIAGGLTNRQIAAELCISLNTVERHTANLYRKLNVRGRVEAAAYAVRVGLADTHPPG